jgi:hypothetical protein
MVTQEEIKEVYGLLKDRKINPTGTFDGGGRFYLTNSDLIAVRAPSRRWPYSHMTAGRTLKYVKAVAAKYQPENLEELRKLV